MTETNSLLKGLQLTVGQTLFDKITSSKVLLVGSGGIGCELLKNLALSGFTHVEVIDLDTIDVSNLNRQFLFRTQHVGMPKCTVACNAALAMLPTMVVEEDDKKDKKPKYIAHHGNVCDNSRFNVNYVKGFDLVLNALDNVAARRRVNRLCLAASVPLVEAGTTGYLGQVTVIDKASNTECYECQQKPTQKVYPICTIRSTPSMPVHTIVWAKELYKLLFGPKVEESMLFEDQTGDEKSTYMDLVLDLRSKLHSDNGAADNGDLLDATGKVVTALYHTEIEKQLGMDRFKTAQKIPSSIPPESIQKALEQKSANVTSKNEGYKQTDVLSKDACIMEIVSCVLDAAAMIKSGEKLLAEFDKDDKLAMRVVTFASNLRSYVFGIEPIQSYYSAKGIAGNIIPAIATTNAIVAGLQILSAFSILKKQVEGKSGELKDVCRYTYCLRNTSRKGYYLQPTSLPDPNPKCFVCKNATINLNVNTDTWTLQMLIKRVIKKALGFMEPSLVLGSSIIYEEGEDIEPEEYAMNLSKKLTDLPAGGIKDQTIVRIEDFTQDLEVDLLFIHQCELEKKRDDGEDDEEEKFVIGGDKPVVSSDTKDGKNEEGAKNDDDDDDDDPIEIVTESISTSNGNGKKRYIIDLDEGDVGGKKKRARAEL
jgi:ubiquitin-like 1-activating enzyme E1 B